ncbi:MAG: alpha/beta fold hydrolase [Candidatus Eremiobacteraeota bacterium]|nr:alpha/beta fold hydrolase [Candidatus Eremiobacteraeota bacterium]MCW5866495.1 alpha/beta fold hydrolase [Candidatus Eremiobacteraeota bacterium]
MKILRAGPASAPNTLILLHGRGATAESILPLYQELTLGPEWRALAPQAPGNSWYPHSFLAPLEENQPYLEQSLQTVHSVIGDLTSERVAILGFSQGACLALEYAARHPRRYAAVLALTGGLIRLRQQGDLKGTPFFLGSGDPDPHVPFRRVEESALSLRGLGARVETRRYPGMPHTINHDQLNHCRALLSAPKGTLK